MNHSITGISESNAIASDRRLMLAVMFVSSRKQYVPTFAHQLASFDVNAFAESGSAKNALETLVRLGVLTKTTVNRNVLAQMPMRFRGEPHGYLLSEEGSEILRSAYAAYRAMNG